MNQVILLGRLTADPELQYIASNQMAVCKFSIAVNRITTDGEKKADFPRITVFGKQAENCEKYLKKGRNVLISGRLQTGSYEKDGKKYYTTDVIGDRVEFVDWGEKKEESSKEEAPTDDVPSGFKGIEEDIPF